METCGNLIACAGIVIPSVLNALFAIVAVASAIAAMTKTPKDDAWVSKAYKLIDTLALNVGYAKQEAKSVGGRFVPE